MKSISSQELRKAWNNFRESKQHIHLPEASLVGGKESTAMFTIAGMQQLIPYLAGKKHPLGTRLYNIQKCVRTVDIDEVGDASHLTFFNMMGNRSLGSYFKKEAVERSREFLVDVLGFDPKKLAVTVFEGDDDAPRDDETPKYWKAVGMPDHKIAYLPADNNRRSPGPVGPCGPDTEIFYRVGKSEFPPQDSNPGNDDDNRLEIWNNVFMEFYRDESGKLTKLKEQNVDTGMGFERMAKVLQNKETVYDTDIFEFLIKNLEDEYPIKYSQDKKSYRIICDHLRTSIFLIREGIVPSNEKRGYILRKIIRRFYYRLKGLHPDYESCKKVIKNTIEHYDNEFGVSEYNCVGIINDEIKQFQQTLLHGEKILEKIVVDLMNKVNDKKLRPTMKIKGSDTFMLYDTYGFPIEIVRDYVSKFNFSVDEDGFNKEMEQQRERSRAGSKDMFKQGVDRSKYVEGMPPTKFVGYGNLHSEDVKLLKDFEVNGQRVLIFDTTPLYGEGGGQMGDSGKIILDGGEELIIKDVKKYEGVFLHFVK